MPSTAFFLAALAVSAVAVPTSASLNTAASKAHDKRREPFWATGGNCGMNIFQLTQKEDESHYAKITLYDDNQNKFHQEDASYNNGFSIGEDIFDEPIEFTRHGKGDGEDILDGHTQGFDVEWHTDKFSTNEEERCRVGVESGTDAADYRGAWNRNFDCVFSC